ncbi:uncharacterized protein HD556DRAFT_1435985 [Suillus plorans]|uniref:Uncharacterized protein n=1 Tax=Suillus plorans TaxID=116603 RepID=A0A9P7J9V2_9AGAM|nr:uncharacterized protein HD556DRAFT_1435985 [Suillus plorans]KAG1810273.1 hypothetical protein HD556DRAFT_1435985 [Suillus plorans]
MTRGHLSRGHGSRQPHHASQKSKGRGRSQSTRAQSSLSPSLSPSPPPAPERVRSRKRRHEESESPTDDSEDDHNHLTKSSIKKDTDPIKSKGRIFGRMGEMWRPFASVLDDGVGRDADDDPQAYTTIQNIHHEIYQELVKIAPGIPDEIKRLGAQGSVIISAKLEVGRRGSRSEDINSMKDKIGRWRTFAPPYNPDHRSMLGFKYPDCGKLLCPASLDWNDSRHHTETTGSVRSNLRDGITKARPDDFPLFLYSDEQVDTEDLFHGFLRNMILVKAGDAHGYLHVFRGPSTATNSVRSGTRKGNAATHSINKVSVPSIAYIATLIRFVLSDQPTFSAGGTSGHWPYRTFYRTLLEVVSIMDSHEREDLLNWWNDKIYADFADLEEENDGMLSMAARMKAQATSASWPRPRPMAVNRENRDNVLESVGTS